MESDFLGVDKKSTTNAIQWLPKRPKVEEFVFDVGTEVGWNNKTVELIENHKIHHVDCNNDYKLRKQLIALIREKPILYDPKHPDFAAKDLKSFAWDSIANQLNIYIGICQDMWSKLRCKYQRYVRRLQRFMYNTERARLYAKRAKRRGTQHRRRPSIRFEVEMMFLYRFIKPVYQIDPDKHRVDDSEVKIPALRLVMSDEDDVVVLDYTEPCVIDLDGEDYRVLPYKYTNQARQLAAAVNAYPELYDTKHCNYRSFRRRGIIWSAIAAELKDKGTKLIKFWIQLVLRYEWEIFVGYAPEYNEGQLMKPSKLQKMLEYLRPFLKDNLNTVFKQSYYLKKDWFDPLDQFKTVVSLLDALKKNPQLVQMTDDVLNNEMKPVTYCKLWEKVAATISCTPEQCEITWLLLRSFYWELVELRKNGYYLQDKWYFEIVIGSLYKTVKSVTSPILKRPTQIANASTKKTQQTTTAASTTTATLPNSRIYGLDQHSRSLLKHSNNLSPTKATLTTASSTIIVSTPWLQPGSTAQELSTLGHQLSPASTATSTKSTLSLQITTQAKAIQNAPSLSTGISSNTSNDSELRLPKIVGAMSLASVHQNLPSVGTPPLIHIHPPTVLQPRRLSTLAAPLKKTVRVQPKECARPINASVSVLVQSNQPNAASGTAHRPLLFPFGTTTSQQFFLRPDAPTATAPATTNANEVESNSLLFNPTPIQVQTPTMSPPVMSVRPQTHTALINKRSLFLPQLPNATQTNNYNALFKSGVTINANHKPTMFIAATTKATNHRIPAKVPSGMTNASHVTANISHGNLNFAQNKDMNCAMENKLADTLEAATSMTVPKPLPTLPLPVLTTTQLTSLLTPNQIVIELVSINQGKQLIVRGPALNRQYALSMPKTASFIREIMAIPLLHNKTSKRMEQINEYWEHIAKKFDMPHNICKACWNFLSDNLEHFPQIAPMSELMRPYKTSLNVWLKAHKLFRRFNSASLKRGWLKHRNELPQLLRLLESHKFLYDDVRRNKISGAIPAQPSAEEKMIVWKKARQLYPNIVHPVEIWLAFKLVFVRYMTDLEEGLDNPWPENWWPALAALKYLVDARYDRLDPFYYIVTNKFEEEHMRCRALDQLINKQTIESIDTSRVTSPTIKTKTTKATEMPNNVILPKSLRQLFIGGAGIDSYEMASLVCQLPAIYTTSSVQAQRPAWQQLAKRMDMTERQCRLTLQYAVRSFLKYDISDPTKCCHLNQKHYKHLAHVYRIVKTRIHNDRSKCTLIELLQQNESPVIMQPKSYIPDINMRNCSVSLVMKNWTHAASQLPNGDVLLKKLQKIFQKYKNLETVSQQ